MKRLLTVRPLAEPLDQASSYDLLVACVGFEKRSRFVSEKLRACATHLEASAFEYNRRLSFHENLTWFASNRFNVREHRDAEFRAWVSSILDSATSGVGEPARVLVDISSMTRDRIAAVVVEAANCSGQRRLDIDFLYAFAEYSDPVAYLTPIATPAPVLPEFAGYAGNPNVPPSCVIGLGYEPGKVLGAFEYLEPGETWLFLPLGEDRRYAEGVREANAIMLEADRGERLIEYDVLDPYGTFYRLESLASGLIAESRPALLPLGPKIFALCAVLVAARHTPVVSVWRVTAGPSEPPNERTATGTVVGIRVEFEPSQPT